MKRNLNILHDGTMTILYCFMSSAVMAFVLNKVEHPVLGMLKIALISMVSSIIFQNIVNQGRHFDFIFFCQGPMSEKKYIIVGVQSSCIHVFNKVGQYNIKMLLTRKESNSTQNRDAIR